MTAKTKILNLIRIIFKIPFIEKGIRWCTQNKSPQHFVSKFAPNNYQYSLNTLRTFKKNDIIFIADISDYVGHYIYFGFRDKSLDKLFSLCAKGNTIIDIGANIGYTILNFAKLVGHEGAIFGFEPDPINFERCNHNIVQNNFTNIHLSKCGLGESMGKFLLHVPSPQNRGGNRIINEKTEGETNVIEVITLDDFVRQKQINKIDLIKIDVEGYELKILKGGESTLKKFKPTLFIEIDDNNLKQQGHSVLLIVDFIKSLGYNNIMRADNDQNISSQYNFPNCHFDIICSHKPE